MRFSHRRIDSCTSDPQAESCYFTTVPELLTSAEAARELGIAVRTLLHRASIKGIKAERQVGSNYLWTRAQVKALGQVRPVGRPRKRRV